MRRTLVYLLCCIVWAVPVCSAQVPAALEKSLAAQMQAAKYRHASWGLAIADLATGKLVYEINGEKLFVPASTTKLFSTAAALEALGPEYVFRTPVYSRGELSAEGELKGDLILRAVGDPNLTGRLTPDGRLVYTETDHSYAGFSDKASVPPADPLVGIEDLAGQVAARGIRRVQDVLVDDRIFEHAESSGSGPTRLTPVSVNDNVLDLVISPAAEPGKAATAQFRPQTSYAQFDMGVTTVPADGKTSVSVAEVAPRRFVVRGQIAQGRKPLVRIAMISEPAEFARVLLIEALRRRGIEVAGSTLAPMDREALPSASEYSSLPKVAEHQSPPLLEAVRVVLKVSQNLHASMLPLLLAVQKGERTLGQGMRRQGEALRRLGVDVDSISFAGGAGGTRADYITPRAAVDLLVAISRRPEYRMYRDALPTLGGDGTLATAVPADSPAKGKAAAKTGTLIWENTMNGRYLMTSKALAGYVTARSGRELAFAVFVNNVALASIPETEQQGQVLGKITELIHNGM